MLRGARCECLNRDPQSHCRKKEKKKRLAGQLKDGNRCFLEVCCSGLKMQRKVKAKPEDDAQSELVDNPDRTAMTWMACVSQANKTLVQKVTLLEGQGWNCCDKIRPHPLSITHATRAGQGTVLELANYSRTYLFSNTWELASTEGNL